MNYSYIYVSLGCLPTHSLLVAKPRPLHFYVTYNMVKFSVIRAVVQLNNLAISTLVSRRLLRSTQLTFPLGLKILKLADSRLLPLPADPVHVTAPSAKPTAHSQRTGRELLPLLSWVFRLDYSAQFEISEGQEYIIKILKIYSTLFHIRPHHANSKPSGSLFWALPALSQWIVKPLDATGSHTARERSGLEIC
jgi:hypothetical protein